MHVSLCCITHCTCMILSFLEFEVSHFYSLEILAYGSLVLSLTLRLPKYSVTLMSIQMIHTTLQSLGSLPFSFFFLLYHLNHPFPWLYASLVITSNVSSPKSQFQSSFPLNTSFWLSCSHLLEEPPQFFHPIMTINFLIQSTLLPNITTHPCFLYYPALLV